MPQPSYHHGQQVSVPLANAGDHKQSLVSLCFIINFSWNISDILTDIHCEVPRARGRHFRGS